MVGMRIRDQKVALEIQEEDKQIDIEEAKPPSLEFDQFIRTNFSIFEKLRGKRLSLIRSAVEKLLTKARQPTTGASEIAEIVYDQRLESRMMSVEEFVRKCQTIQNLFIVVDSLVRRFGEVHLEQRRDDYAVLRVIFNEDSRMKS